jgi:hypothetical protein
VYLSKERKEKTRSEEIIPHVNILINSPDALRLRGNAINAGINITHVIIESLFPKMTPLE